MFKTLAICSIVLAISSFANATCTVIHQDSVHKQIRCDTQRYDPNTYEWVSLIKMCNVAGTSCLTQGWIGHDVYGNLDQTVGTYSGSNVVYAVNNLNNNMAKSLPGFFYLNFPAFTLTLPLQGAGNANSGYDETVYANSVWDGFYDPWLDRMHNCPDPRNCTQ